MGASLEVSSVRPGISGWFKAVVFWNCGKNCIASAYMATAAKWASFIALRGVCIVHKHASSWPTNLIDVQWANISYLIIILSIFSHGSEKKLAGVLRGLTNQPHVRKSTCDTPLQPPQILNLVIHEPMET